MTADNFKDFGRELGDIAVGAGRDRVSLGREELGTSRGPKGVRVGSLLQERVSSSGPFGRVVAR